MEMERLSNIISMILPKNLAILDNFPTHFLNAENLIKIKLNLSE